MDGTQKMSQSKVKDHFQENVKKTEAFVMKAKPKSCLTKEPSNPRYFWLLFRTEVSDSFGW